MSLHCRNTFDWLRGGYDASWMDHHKWWVMGFRIQSLHKASANAVEEEWRTMAQKSSRGTVPAEIDINFIFRCPRYGDGGMSAISKKCRHCFLYRNALEIKRPELWVENLFVLHYNNTSSHRADSVQKFLEKNNMWLMTHPPYSPDLAACDFFIFPKLKLALKGSIWGIWKEYNGKQTPTCGAFPYLTSKGVMMIGYCIYGSV